MAAAEPWPGFRGPTGQGYSKEIRLPVSWNATRDVIWKTPIPGESWSSPVVWGGRVFVTTARDEGRACHVLALDRRTGEVLWDTLVFTQTLKRKEGRNTYATPTPVTDGARVYASFGDGSFAAVDAVNGKVVWTNRDYPVLRPARPGHLARPVSRPGDHGARRQQRGRRQGARLADAVGPVLRHRARRRTGRQRWKASRGLSRIAHVTPIVARIAARDVLVSPAGDVVQAFDLATGARLWSVASTGEGVVPSPVMAGGLVVTVSGFGAPAVRAVRPGAAPAVAWEQTKGVPMQASPVASEGLVFLVSDAGILSALDQSDRRAGVAAAAGGRVLGVAGRGRRQALSAQRGVRDLRGRARGWRRTRCCREIRSKATARRPWPCRAASLFIRSDTALYAIGQAR